MKKNMYSIMLAEDVVRAIDERAAAEGTNRSNLINQILAEYVSVLTPEQAIFDIFNSVDSLLGNLIPLSYRQHDNTLSLKSALSYRYRPTVRYDVELHRNFQHRFGVLKVSFRSQVSELSTRMYQFFVLWEQLEKVYFARIANEEIDSCYDCGKWLRTLILPRDNASRDAISQAISSYVKVLDTLLKKYMDGASADEIETDYLNALNDGLLLI